LSKSNTNAEYFSPREASTLAIVLATIAGAYGIVILENTELTTESRMFFTFLIAGIGMLYRENTIWRESRECKLLKDPKTKIAANRFINSLLIRLFQASPLLYLFIIKYPNMPYQPYIVSALIFAITVLTINEHVRLYKDKPSPDTQHEQEK
jgi:hypothetical protein